MMTPDQIRTILDRFNADGISVKAIETIAARIALARSGLEAR